MAALAQAKASKVREEWLKFVFLGTQPSFLAGGSWPPGSAISSLYATLHTADPGEAGSPSTSEATYGGYARVAIARTSGGWTIDEPTTGAWRVRNAAAIPFAAKTDAGSQSLTHLGICTASSGGKLLYRIPLPGGPLAISQYQSRTIPALAVTIKEL